MLAAFVAATISGVASADAGAAASASSGNTTQKFEILPQLPEPAMCTEQTGTRIKAAAGDCISSLPVASYGKSEMDLIGATNVGDALRKLDSRVTIRQ
jgi:hypothetical protein